MRVLIAAALVLFSGTALGAGIGTCNVYVTEALEQVASAARLGCGISGPRWSSDPNVHRRWCYGANEESVEHERWFRSGFLQTCTRCMNYARAAVAAAQENAQLGCGYAGPRWVTDLRAHYNWCMSNDIYTAVVEEERGRGYEIEMCKSRQTTAQPLTVAPDDPNAGHTLGRRRRPFDPAGPMGDAAGSLRGGTAIDPTRPLGDVDSTVVEGLSHQFNAPTVGNYGVDVCLNWGTNCGQPAADEFCRRHGYARSTAQGVFESGPPTLVLGDNAVCDQSFCNRFAYITCSR